MQHPVVDIDLLRIGEVTEVLTMDLVRQPTADVSDRIDDVLAIGLQRYGEVAAAHGIKPRARRNHPLCRLNTDLTPFINQPGANQFVGLIHISIEEFESEAFLPGLLEQAARLSA